MARLLFSAICSLDGYVADSDGRFDWAAPDEEVHAFVNDRERDVGTYLYGRRMFEVMRYWAEPDPEADASSPAMRDYRTVWQAADKVVHSRTLDSVATPRTTLTDRFDPDAVRRLKDGADRDLSVGGPGLAAEALHHGLVDEVALLVTPVVVGGGTRALPGGLRCDLVLTGQRRFGSGVVFLQYDVRT